MNISSFESMVEGLDSAFLQAISLGSVRRVLCVYREFWEGEHSEFIESSVDFAWIRVATGSIDLSRLSSFYSKVEKELDFYTEQEIELTRDVLIGLIYALESVRTEVHKDVVVAGWRVWNKVTEVIERIDDCYLDEPGVSAVVEETLWRQNAIQWCRRAVGNAPPDWEDFLKLEPYPSKWSVNL